MCSINNDCNVMYVPDFYKGYSQMEVMEIGMKKYPKGSIIPFEEVIDEGKKIIDTLPNHIKINNDDNFNYYGDDLGNHIYDKN